MCKDSITAYINSGLNIAPEPKQFRMLASGSVLIALICVVPGVVLKHFWLLISIIMLVTSFAAFASVWVVSSKDLTVKNRLVLQSIIYSSLILQISLLEMMFVTMEYGFNLSLFISYLPPLLIPLWAGVKFAKKIKANITLDFKNTTTVRVRLAGIMMGILGMRLASAFQNIDQGTATIVILVCCMFLNCGLSSGLLAFHRLYYLLKFGK